MASAADNRSRPRSRAISLKKSAEVASEIVDRRVGGHCVPSSTCSPNEVKAIRRYGSPFEFLFILNTFHKLFDNDELR